MGRKCDSPSVLISPWWNFPPPHLKREHQCHVKWHCHSACHLWKLLPQVHLVSSYVFFVHSFNATSSRMASLTVDWSGLLFLLPEQLGLLYESSYLGWQWHNSVVLFLMSASLMRLWASGWGPGWSCLYCSCNTHHNWNTMGPKEIFVGWVKEWMNVHAEK